MQFNSDVGAVFLELLEVLSDPILSTNEETLRSIMTRPLVERFRSEHQKFLENGEYVEYIVPELRKVLGKNIASTTIKNVALSVQPERKLTTATGTLRESDAALQDEPSPSTLSIIDRPLLSTITESYLADRIKLPKVTIRGIHFTYGPFPAPQEYVQQHWWSLITLLIPPGDDSFVSHPRQQEIMKIASDQGVVMRIDVRVDLDRLGGVEFVHWDKNGIPTVRDKRSKIDLQFISPHFTPWDELFELDEAGEWRLRFRWRISDIDGLLTSQQPVRNTKHKIDWKTKVI
ncbi:hypothetical protein HK096_001546 [Nowakowskiella sp. JEL0078]|nr:hypothetical protein HK096_001546 [Nowakowskiella sp. JEL0078]